MRPLIFLLGTLLSAVGGTHAPLALSASPAVQAPVNVADSANHCVVDPRSREDHPFIYPAYRLASGIERTMMVLRITVDTNGKPTSVYVSKSSINRSLDRQVMEAARQWTFACPPNAEGKAGGLVSVELEPPVCTLDMQNKQRHPPRYPSEAALLEQRGHVELHLRPRTSAGDSEVRLGRSSGYPLLDRAALEAAQHWRFNCPTDAPMPASWVSLPVDFWL